MTEWDDSLRGRCSRPGGRERIKTLFFLRISYSAPVDDTLLALPVCSAPDHGAKDRTDSSSRTVPAQGQEGPRQATRKARVEGLAGAAQPLQRYCSKLVSPVPRPRNRPGAGVAGMRSGHGWGRLRQGMSQAGLFLLQFPSARRARPACPMARSRPLPAPCSLPVSSTLHATGPDTGNGLRRPLGVPDGVTLRLLW
jgi:hypothetical protein